MIKNAYSEACLGPAVNSRWYCRTVLWYTLLSIGKFYFKAHFIMFILRISFRLEAWHYCKRLIFLVR